MSNIKAWVLRLFGLSALAAVMAPWHHAPAVSASPSVVPQVVTKTQDRLPQEVWPKIEGPAPVVVPTDISPAASAATTSKPVPMAVKAKRRPQRHVLSNPEPVEDDWMSSAVKAAARLAGAIQ